ncbi:hypothetical protein TNCV_2339401 [Trichonephila clavipes]|nr:hypothetical protein TNCV_2339401 [Trichonephila clavipes]
MPRDKTYNGLGFPWFSKALGFLGHCSRFVNVCGNNALCFSEGQGDLRLRRLGFLLGFLVSSFIAEDPNMTWDPLNTNAIGDTPPSSPYTIITPSQPMQSRGGASSGVVHVP